MASTTAFTPEPSLHTPTDASSLAPSDRAPSPPHYRQSADAASLAASSTAPLARTVSRAESTRSVASSVRTLDPKRPAFKLTQKTRKTGQPTESVAEFKRGEYFGQRPLYVAAFCAGYFIGSPDLAMNVVKGVEKGVVRVTGLSADPVADKRERKRKAALAKLSAMEEYGVTPAPAAAAAVAPAPGGASTAEAEVAKEDEAVKPVA